MKNKKLDQRSEIKVTLQAKIIKAVIIFAIWVSVKVEVLKEDWNK